MGDRVTWLIPIKNGMPFLSETLASIEAQTYPNWEVLAWDDGSTDGTLEELKKWIPARLPGRIITSDVSLGVGGALARMVEECKTELCARIDADDINLPNRLEQQVNFLASHPDIAVVGTQMQSINEKGEFCDPKIILPLQHMDIVHVMLLQNSIAHPSVLFRRSAILRVGNYRDIPNVEDYDLWLRVASHYRLENLDKPLIQYRFHSQSATRTAYREDKMASAMNSCLSANAPVLFGTSKDEIISLREKKHPFAFQAIYKIAQYLETTQQFGLLAQLTSNSFIQTCKHFVSNKDISTHLILAGLDWQHPLAIPAEVLRIAKSLLQAIPGLRLLVRAVRNFREERRWQQKLKKWLEERHRENTFIHPTIYFPGSTQPDLDSLKIAPECYIDKEFSLWISLDLGSEPKFEMKKKVYIARNTFINVFKPVTIGEYAQIGAYSYITSANHCFEKRDIPIVQQGFVGAPVLIEDDVWIGTHVVVLPGVTIGKGAIVGAGSIVTKSIPPYEIWAGIPAKFIKKRP